MSNARAWTDKELAKMEREIAKIYKQAEKEMREKWEAYMLKGNSRISALEKDYRDALKVGDEEIIADIEERLKKAKENFTFKNDYYRDMVNSVTLDMAEVNNKAREYVNGKIPEIYAKNYEEANEIIKDMQLSFTLPNENAIKNRILEGKIKTPYMRTTNFIKIPKDQRWNTKFINSEVLQGIIQGEDMRTISKRIFPEIHGKAPKEGLSKEELKGLEKRNRAAAIRNARTLVTGAENQGKHDSYEDLSERGIVLKQVWIATGDDRTRESHLEMDGQEVDVGEPFIAINRDGSQSELMYPADPNGDAEQVYNCRCALISKVIGFRNADGTIRMISEINEGQDLHDKQIAAEVQRRKEKSEQKKIEKVIASDLNQDLQDTLHRYTDGEYRSICDYSQYVLTKGTDANPSSSTSSRKWWEENRLPNISEKERKETEELIEIISTQPITEEPLVRIEKDINIAEEGDVLTFGIRSTSASEDFVEITTKGDMQGLEHDYLGSENDGLWTEYRFVNSKNLDISSVSAYKEQNERLICGNYRVVKTEIIEPQKEGFVPKKMKMEDVAENIEPFVSKSGKNMIRYTYDGKQMTDTVEKFNSRTVEEFIKQTGIWGRKIIYLEVV